MTEEQTDALEQQADELWTKLWNAFFEVRDDQWPQQGQRLQTISDLSLELRGLIQGLNQEAP